jgi:hypothetical protein
MLFSIRTIFAFIRLPATFEFGYKSRSLSDSGVRTMSCNAQHGVLDGSKYESGHCLSILKSLYRRSLSGVRGRLSRGSQNIGDEVEGYFLFTRLKPQTCGRKSRTNRTRWEYLPGSRARSKEDALKQSGWRSGCRCDAEVLPSVLSELGR